MKVLCKVQFSKANKQTNKHTRKNLYKYVVSINIDSFRFCCRIYVDYIGLMTFVGIHSDFFVRLKGSYELVRTTYGREVGSGVTSRTWLKDLAKKIFMRNGKKTPDVSSKLCSQSES